MLSFLNRYATPLITGLFLVSLISGVALFFHFGSSYFHSMHEWLSMVLIVPFVLHIWKNWRPMVSYMKHLPMTVALVVSATLALAFAYPALTAPAGQGMGGRGGPPAFQLATKVMNGTVSEMAAVLDISPEALADALNGAGMTVGSVDEDLNSIAARAGKDSNAVAALLNGL